MEPENVLKNVTPKDYEQTTYGTLDQHVKRKSLLYMMSNIEKYPQCS